MSIKLEQDFEELNIKMTKLEERLQKLELILSHNNYYILNPIVEKSSNNCPQCQQDLSKNPVCGSVNCPYSYKVTCSVK